MAERDNLMRAIRAARTGGQLAAAVAALDAHDRHRTASAAQSRETDLSATAVRQTLEPVPAFEHHTAATDWLGDVEIPSDYRTAMIAEASRWYRGIPRDLMADPDEFNEQALGHAYTAASSYGTHALAARKEFMTYVGYLTRQGASGLPQIQQSEDPKDNPAPTPLPQETFDNFAPPQNQYNTAVESPSGQSQVTSEQAPMMQQVEQMNGSGSGFGSGPEQPLEHSTTMDVSNSYAEVPLGPPGTISTIPPGPAPSAPSTPNPALGQNMDEGSEQRPTAERQASMRVSAYTRPDQDGFRWHIGADQDVDTFDTPYHERCGSLHWPEQDCHRGQAHTASVAVGYVMNAEDFARRAHFEAMGSAEGIATLRAAQGDLSRVARHHDTLTGSFRTAARSEDEIAWLHGYLARVRPFLAAGVPKGFREPEDDTDQDGKKNKKKKKGKGKPWDKTGSRLDFPLAAEAAMRKGAPFAGYADFDACVAANSDKNSPDSYCGTIKHQVEGSQRTAYYGEGIGGGYGSSDEDMWEPHVQPHMRSTFRDLHRIDPQGGEREPTEDDLDRFERHVRANYPSDIADAYFRRHQGASSLPQIQETVDSHDNPNPGGDQLNTAVMFPLNPAWVSGESGGDEDQGQGKQAARSSMTPSNRALQMFGRMDAMEGKPPPHKDSYVFGVKGHGQYLRGHNETRGSIDAIMGRDPVSKEKYAEQTGRPDLHAHYLGAYSEVKARRSQESPPEVTASLRRQADTLTRPHQSTDDLNPPFNSGQTTPDPWSSNEGGGDYDQGVRDGQDDAQAGEHPTFSDNSSRVSPYVQGYSVGYSGRPPDTGRQDVPRSIGGDSGQAGNAADAERAFQVSKASLQRTAACIGCGHRSHLGEPCGEVGCTDQHYEGEMGGGPGSHAVRIPEGWEKDPRSYQVKRKTMWQDHEGARHQARDFSEAERKSAESEGDTLPGTTKLPIKSRQDLENAEHLKGNVKGESESKIDAYLDRKKKEFGKAAFTVSAAFITREAVDDGEFAKGYKYAARWQPGTRLVAMGSPAFEAGLYAAIADRPGGVQARWVVAHQRMSARHSVLARRLDAHAGFTRKLILAEPGQYRPSATGCYPVRRQAATSVDLITDGPGTSPDPMGSTPINGPGQPPPMGGGEDPARSGGPSPYQGAPPPASPPVAPDDAIGQPQEPPQAGGPFTQTFSGRHPENAGMAPVAPDAAGQSGYSNEDAAQGDPVHKQQAMAFRRRVQAGLAARRAS